MSLLSGVEWSGVPSCCVFVTPSHPVNQIESHPRESLSTRHSASMPQQTVSL